jgi:hypothetical protein
LKTKSKPNKGKSIIGFAKLSIPAKGKGNILSSILYLQCKYKWLNIGLIKIFNISTTHYQTWKNIISCAFGIANMNHEISNILSNN